MHSVQRNKKNSIIAFHASVAVFMQLRAPWGKACTFLYFKL